MILEGSQRAGGKQLGLHLLNAENNEHIEIHEVRGFVSESVLGAMNEAYAMSRGTKCTQFLFSLSLSPPSSESVPVQTFEKAIETIEERLGLSGQPRIVVFHEKEGRRHAHCVWSRIDADTMTARPVSHFKFKLRDISRQLYMENGWKMPQGFMNSAERDPRNFTLDEWQKSKRVGYDLRAIKETMADCWAVSDSLPSFSRALEERGMFLAQGDRRAHVAVTYEGHVVSVAKMIGKPTREVQARLGNPDALPSVADTLKRIASDIAPRIADYIAVAKRRAAEAMKSLETERQTMTLRHAEERAKLDFGQRQRTQAEVKERASRFRKGIAGLWDRLNGEHAKIKKRNELEAFSALERDRRQRDALVLAQLDERRDLQRRTRDKRRESAAVVLALFKDAARYRDMRNGQATAKTGRGSSGRGQNARGQDKPRGLDLD